MPRGQRFLDRFWDKIAVVDDDHSCWLWTASTSGTGYGSFSRKNGVMAPAHRVMMEFLVGPLPSITYVCHRCDNPLCVRPDHLFIGTQEDNLRDCASKSRMWGGPRPRGRSTTCRYCGGPRDIKLGYAVCRPCHRERHASYQRARRARKKSAACMSAASEVELKSTHTPLEDWR